jgi:hypothetical protein
MDSNKKPASPENGGNRFNGFWIYIVFKPDKNFFIDLFY